MSYGFVHRRFAQSSEIGFDPASYTVEGAAGSAAELVVKRRGSTSQACTVSYATVDGTAEAGIDYVAATGTLNWPAGDGTDKTIEVGALDVVSLRWNPASLNVATVDGARKVLTTQSGSSGETYGVPGSAGQVYFEISFADGTPLNDGSYCVVGFTNGVGFYIELYTKFGAGAGLLAHGISTSLSPASPLLSNFASGTGVVGFLIDWDASEIKVSVNGEWIHYLTGQGFPSPTDVPGVPFSGGELRAYVTLTGPS